MDIDRIRYFLVFAETGSLVKASEVLSISQPALSKALRLLEHEVGAKLTEPNGRGIRLTSAGLALKQETSELLNQWLSIPGKLKGVGQLAPTRLGSFEVFTTYFLGHLMNYVDLGPLEVHELGPGALEEALQQGSVDLGITYLPIPTRGLEFTEIAKVRMGVFGLAKKFKDVEFSKLPFVIPLHPNRGTPSKVMGLDGWPDHKIPRNVKYRVKLMESAMQLCRKGHSTAYLPEFVVKLHNEDVRPERRLVELEAPLPEKDRLQSVFLVQRQNTTETQLHRGIAKCARSLMSR